MSNKWFNLGKMICEMTIEQVPILVTLASEGIFESLSHIVTVLGLDRLLGSKS